MQIAVSWAYLVTIAGGFKPELGLGKGKLGLLIDGVWTLRSITGVLYLRYVALQYRQARVSQRFLRCGANAMHRSQPDGARTRASSKCSRPVSSATRSSKNRPTTCRTRTHRANLQPSLIARLRSAHQLRVLTWSTTAVVRVVSGNERRGLLDIVTAKLVEMAGGVIAEQVLAERLPLRHSPRPGACCQLVPTLPRLISAPLMFRAKWEKTHQAFFDEATGGSSLACCRRP